MVLENDSFLRQITAKLEAASAYLEDLPVEKDHDEKSEEGIDLSLTSEVGSSESVLEDDETRRLFFQKIDGYKTILTHALTSLDFINDNLRRKRQTTAILGGISPEAHEREASVTFNTLPNDVLREIYCITIQKSARTESRVAIRLSAINRRSRELVINTKSFWATLSTKVSTAVNFLSLERSQEYLITVHMHDHNLWKFLTDVGSASHRFGNLRFYDNPSWRTFWKDFYHMKGELKSITFVDNRGVSIPKSDYTGTDNFNDFLPLSIKNYSGQWYCRRQNSQWTSNFTRCLFQFYSNTSEEYEPSYVLPFCEVLELEFLQETSDLQRVSESPICWEDSEYEDPGYEKSLNHESAYVPLFGITLLGGDRFRWLRSSLPKLRHVSITMHRYMHIFLAGRTLLYMPLHQLTSLKLDLRFRISASRFFDIFTTNDFTALKTFEIVYPRLQDNAKDICLLRMPNLEHIIIRGVSGFQAFEMYVSYIKSMPAIRTILFDNCEIFEPQLVDLAEALSDKSRFQDFARLLLCRCPIQPLISRRLKSVLHHKFKYET